MVRRGGQMDWEMDILDKIVNQSRKIFGDELIGIYLHGSMAMGCFNPDKSDIDLIFVIRDHIMDTQKMQFIFPMHIYSGLWKSRMIILAK